MFGYVTQTTREQQLEDEVYEMRRREQERQDQERREYEQQRREQREAAYWRERQAASWPEALRKQARLFLEEACQYGPDDEPDTLFGPGAKACEKALDIWVEEEASAAEQIKALEAQIAALQNGVRMRVADRLEAAAPSGVTRYGWEHVADALRTEDPTSWLQW